MFGKRYFLWAVFVVFLAAGLGASLIFAASYTPDPTNRVRLNFNTDWKFYLGNASGAQASAFNDSSWTIVNLPHTVRIESLNCSGNRNYQGICWYRRHFTIDSSYSSRKVFVEFEAGMSVAQVWINGTSLITHYGGYTPFTIDITPYITFGGADNVIAVQLNNSDNVQVPPGKTQATLDFCYFGGLYRDVNMHITDKLHVTDAVYANKAGDGGILVTYSSVSAGSATVQIKTNVKNENTVSKSCTIKNTIVDPANNQIVATLTSSAQNIGAGSDYTFTQSTTITTPRLWTPDAPNLYVVYTAVQDGGVSVDNYQTTIGIRTVAFSKANGFQINGTRLKFMGANRHQEYPYIGNAASNNLQYRDAVKYKEAGFQFIRLSHYPQDPSFLDACDKLGIMVLESIPGWQYVGDTTFLNRSYQDMRDMMRRDRNHPSVICWELSLNESNFDATYASNAVSIGHTELPGSKIGGWKFDTTYDVYLCSSQASARSYSGSQPCIIDEYGDWDYGGNSSTSRVGRGDGEAKMLIQESNFRESLNANRALSWETGDGVWLGGDYNRGYQSTIEKSGVFDLFRLPKFSYYFYQSQRDPNLIIPGINSGPMVYIASWWTSSSSTSVKVFSNCDQVKLSLNGNVIATRTPDTGQNSLLRQPFTFSGVAFVSGALKAEGLIGGVVKATYTVTTPGTANKLSVVADTCGINPVADGSDIVLVYAYVNDASGNVVSTNNSTQVTFSISGPGVIVGTNPATAEAGIAGALVRTTRTAGTITVTASASGLTSGNATITSQAMTEVTVPLPNTGATPTPSLPVTPTASPTPTATITPTLTPDAAPDQFTFTDVTNSELSTLVESNVFMVTGTNMASSISITGGEYNINSSGTWSSISGTVNPSDAVKVRLTSSASYATRVSAVLNIGGVQDSFDVTTKSSATASPSPTPAPTNLALNKTASADSEETSKGNTAPKGNDGSTTTRWCASNGNANHWWKVDLGSSYTLTGSEVMWEKSGQVYRYKVEVSTDNTNWTMKVDKTSNTSTAQTQTDNFSAAARYVRITVTGLPSSSVWASFFEFRVFGY